MRVVIVDDHELMRRGIRMLLETADDLEVVGEAADGVEALSVVRRTQPDVVLTDARMPGLDGVGLIDALTRMPSAPPVIVLTTFDDEELVRSALDAGASGFLVKDATTVELVSAIRAVERGGLVIDPRVARGALRRREVGPPSDSPLRTLTRSERHVARLVATGASNAEIARTLHLAEGSVKNVVSALLRKLERRDRTGLALFIAQSRDQLDALDVGEGAAD